MSIRFLLLVAALLVLGGPKASTFAQDTRDKYSQMMRGQNLTPEQAASLEKKLEQNPYDLASRTLLLHYYSGPGQFMNRSAREPKRSHVLWLIHNRPEAEMLADHSAQINSHFDPEGYVEGKNAWMHQLQREPANLKLLEHAAEFFQQFDRQLAIELLHQAQSLDENNPKWPKKLGHIYSWDISIARLLDQLAEDSSKAKTKAANKALAQFERAYHLSDGKRRDTLLDYLARMAFAAEKYKKAREYAEALLDGSSLSIRHSNYGSGRRVHHGNIVLGRIALIEDDVQEAKKRLLAAGKTSGSPTLVSFGPDMGLAKDLLEKGEKEVVLEYFKLCSKFWEMGNDRLDEWSVLVRGGRIPDFGANLKY